MPSEIRYACERCGNCCRWPGDVRLTGADVTALAAHLDLAETDFIDRHTRLNSTRSGLSLTERSDGACSFLQAGEGNTSACAVHPAKPAQCRGFPNHWRFPGWRQICAAVPESPLSLRSSRNPRPPEPGAGAGVPPETALPGC